MYRNSEPLPAVIVDPAFDAGVWTRAQQDRLLHRHLRLGALGSTFTTLILAMLFWPVTPRLPLLVWTGVSASIGLVRLAFCYAIGNRAGTQSPQWRRLYLGGVGLSGLSWAAASIFLFPSGSPIHQAFLTVILAGLTATAATVHAHARGGFLLFALPALLPLAAQFALQGDVVHYAMAGMVVAFALLMALAARETTRSFAEVLSLQVENLELTRALHHQATHDSLVDLVNHGEFKRRLEALATVAAVRHEPYALVFVDLDLFKNVNDRGGHAAGDEMLRQIGAILKSKVRAHDTTARLGGDEFGILLARCPPEQAQRIARELLPAIATFELNWGSQVFRVGASIGVAYTTAGEHDAATLLKAADAACYAAKQAGRNQVRMFHADPSFASTGRFHLSAFCAG